MSESKEALAEFEAVPHRAACSEVAESEEEGFDLRELPERGPIDRGGEPLLSIEDVSQVIDGNVVLRDVSFKVWPGEIFGIMGMSGSGKTTLLRLLIGLDRPTEGRVLFKGEDITQLDEDGLNRVRKSMGMCFQYSALFDSMTVAENVAFVLRNRRDIGPEEKRRRVATLLEMVEMAGTEDRMPADLSGGMRKRVSIARSLMEEPELVLYDEPSSGLDPVMSCNITGLIRKVSTDTGSTAVIVSHDVLNLLGICDRLLMLHRHTVELLGTPDEMRDSDIPVVHRFVHGLGTGEMTEHCSQNPEVIDSVG
ncbi:MAG: ABC transporter ATP-binding protein [Armatimonadota bacterium]|jgi:phospholipid/cholesterol/gamma-HCH transport system ATP-binding protein